MTQFFFVMIARGDRPYPLMENNAGDPRVRLFATRREAAAEAAQHGNAQAYGFEVYPWEMPVK